MIYRVSNPSISATFFGAGTFTTTTPGTLNITANIADYPRNVELSVTGGTSGGTVTVYGRDQFGYKTSESMGVGTAASGGSVAGTKIFATVGSASFTNANTNTATASLGFASGTAANQVAIFGLPTKIAGTKDVVGLNWINNGTIVVFNSPQAQVKASPNYSFQGTHTLAITDQYEVKIRPQFDNGGNANNLANLDTTVTS